MLKSVSREEMYLICARLKNEAVMQTKMAVPSMLSKDILTVCNEMIELLDLMPQLHTAVKLESLVKDLHNHLHNH